MIRKICTPAPSNDDNLVITENLTKKEKHCNTKKIKSPEQPFQFNSSNDNAKNNITTSTTSSRTELFTSQISSHFHSNSISSTTTNTVITSSTCSSINVPTEKTPLCASKTAPATCRRRRPRIKLNLQPDVVGNPQCSTRMYSSSAPNSMNSKNMCMYPIDSGYSTVLELIKNGWFHPILFFANFYFSNLRFF